MLCQAIWKPMVVVHGFATKKDPLCTFHIPKMIYVAHIYSSPINLCFAIVANQVNQIISEQFEDHSLSTFSLKPTRWGILLKIIISTLFELRISGHLEHEYVDQTRCVNLRSAVMRGRRSVMAPDNVPSADVFWHAGNQWFRTILISLPLTVMRILKKVRLSFSLDVAFTFTIL